jgi:drug/metabolite transporter (DMT)-like permease
VLCSALLHAWWSVSIKGSRQPLAFNVIQILPPVAVALLIVPAIHLHEIPAPVAGFLAATGVAHALYFYWMSRAYEEGELTLVYPISRSTPAFLPLVAVPLFGEPITVAGAAGIAIVVGGMWLVHAGQGMRWRALVGPGTGYAYLTLAATVAYSLADKGAMSELASAPWTSPVPRAVAYYLLLTAASSLLFAPLALRRCGLAAVSEAARRELASAILAACVIFASYALILKALETAPASYVVAVRQTSVLFAVVLGVAVLRERPGRPRAIGAAVTVLGVAVIATWGGPG